MQKCDIVTLLQMTGNNSHNYHNDDNNNHDCIHTQANVREPRLPFDNDKIVYKYINIYRTVR